jgi:16S rRNA (guanine966-N2)-methyltransferase
MKNKKITTRIIAGKYKGKTINLPSLESTRSSKAILKESFFNVLQYDIVDTIFIEAFGGSGSIGLEAISRGANMSYFIEINNKAYEVLKNNCKIIDNKSSKIFNGDTFEILPNIIDNECKNYNKEIILYLDPPFDYREGMQDIYNKVFKMLESFNNTNISLIVFEHKSELILDDSIGRYSKYKNKKFGNSSLTYYKTIK